MAAISMRAVRKSYGANQVVHGIDLDIEAGEFIVILGPSGCGKSTLLRMIAGLESISEGEIAIGGRVVNRLEPRERECAMVFQNYALYPHMTAGENIGYALKVAGVPKAERQRRVREVAKIVGLEDLLERRPAAMSGGQRQRVAMGRAMIREPKVFLFDEPLSNLDARLRVQMRSEIRRLHRRLKTTSIFVTHDQVEAMTLADRLVVMNGGSIEQAGTPAEVYNHPASRFVAGFVGAPSMNLIDGQASGDIFTADDGPSFPLPPALAGVGRGTIGIRPEAARLVPAGTEGAIAAVLDFIEELGAGRIIQVDLGGISFAISSAEPVTASPGQPLGVLIDPASMHRFNEDGKRVR